MDDALHKDFWINFPFAHDVLDIRSGLNKGDTPGTRGQRSQPHQVGTFHEMNRLLIWATAQKVGDCVGKPGRNWHHKVCPLRIWKADLVELQMDS